MKISFQADYSPDHHSSIQSTIESTLKATQNNNYDVSDEVFIEFDYTYKTDTIGLTGFFNPTTRCSQGFINDFVDTLRNEDAIQWVGKFHDAHMKSSYAQHTQDIFDIEMKLRKVLTFIFLNRYPNTPYDVLSEFKHKPKVRSVTHQRAIAPQNVKRHSNLYLKMSFFTCFFSDYIKLDHHALKPIGNDDVISAILPLKILKHSKIN